MRLRANESQVEGLRFALHAIAVSRASVMPPLTVDQVAERWQCETGEAQRLLDVAAEGGFIEPFFVGHLRRYPLFQIIGIETVGGDGVSAGGV